jgi:hypothetical protein
VGYVAVPEPSLAGRQVRSYGTRDSTEALLNREAGPKPWDTWKHRSPPQQGGGSGAVGYVAAPEPSSMERQCPELWDIWQHVLLLVLASCMYAGAPSLQGTDTTLSSLFSFVFFVGSDVNQPSNLRWKHFFTFLNFEMDFPKNSLCETPKHGSRIRQISPHIGGIDGSDF